LEDAIKVFDEFVREHKSPDLILDWESAEAKYNTNLLLEHIGKNKKYGGWVTISSLQEADQALGAKLHRTPPPKVKTQDELAAEFQATELVRIQREQLENAVPFQDRMAAAEKAKKEREKETHRQASAKGKRDRLITDFSVSAGPGRIDEACTQYFRNQLLQVLVKKNGQPDWILTVVEVEKVLRNMDDDDKLRRQFAALVRAQANAKVNQRATPTV